MAAVAPADLHVHAGGLGRESFVPRLLWDRQGADGDGLRSRGAAVHLPHLGSGASKRSQLIHGAVKDTHGIPPCSIGPVPVVRSPLP